MPVDHVFSYGASIDAVEGPQGAIGEHLHGSQAQHVVAETRPEPQGKRLAERLMGDSLHDAQAKLSGGPHLLESLECKRPVEIVDAGEAAPVDLLLRPAHHEGKLPRQRARDNRLDKTHCVVQQDSRRHAVTAVHDLPARRVRGVQPDPRFLQRQGIDPERVPVLCLQHHGIARRGVIQGQPVGKRAVSPDVVVPSRSRDPRLGRNLPGPGPHALQGLRKRCRLRIHAVQGLRVPHEVQVAVGEPGERAAAAQVHLLHAAGAGKRGARAWRLPHVQEAAVADCHGMRQRRARLHCSKSPVEKKEPVRACRPAHSLCSQTRQMRQGLPPIFTVVSVNMRTTSLVSRGTVGSLHSSCQAREVTDHRGQGRPGGAHGRSTSPLARPRRRGSCGMEISPVDFHILRILWYMYEKGKVS